MSTPAPTSSQRRPGDAARGRPPRGGRPDRSAGPRGRPAGGRLDGLDRLRVLLAGSMGAILAGYTLNVPLVAILQATGGADVSFDGALATAVPMWLAAHQIPLVVDGQPLGVLPLTSTAVVFAVVAVASAWSVRRLGGRVRHDAGAVIAGQAGAAAAVAVLGGALLPRDMAVTAPWSSMVGAGLVAGTAAAVGVLRVCRLPKAWRARLAGWPQAGLAGARVGALALLLVGALVLLGGLVVHAGAVARTFVTLAPGPFAGLGVAVLAVGYLPNALIGGLAWALGPGVAVGAAQSGPFGAVAGPLPPFPLFAALPVGPVPVWAVLVLLLPLGAGALTGLACARALGPDAERADRLAAAGLATGVLAAGAGLAAGVAGGSLAAGPYDPVSMSGWLVPLAAVLLVGAPAVAVCVGLDRPGRPASARDVATARRAARTAAAARGTSARERSGTSSTGGSDTDGPAAGTAGTEKSGARKSGTGKAEEGTARAGKAGPGTGKPVTGTSATAKAGPDTAGEKARDRRTPANGATAGTDEPDTSSTRPGDGSEDTPDAAGSADGDDRSAEAPPRTVADLVARREREGSSDAPQDDDTSDDTSDDTDDADDR